MSHTLLLNKDYNPISVLPLSVINWQHSIKLMFLGRIQVLETYNDWHVRSEKLTLNVPSVAVTNEYFNLRRKVRFSRHNIYLRDLYQCQYCEDTFDFKDLTIDHVIPRSKGGKSTWENCVISCKPCNVAKGSKLWNPRHEPKTPTYYHMAALRSRFPFHVKHASWLDYLPNGQLVDAAPLAHSA